MPDQKTMRTRCLGGFSVMCIPKLLLSPVKIRIFCPKWQNFAQKLHFWSFWARPCQPIWWVGWWLWLVNNPKWFKKDRNGQPKCFRPFRTLLGPSGLFWTIVNKTYFVALVPSAKSYFVHLGQKIHLSLKGIETIWAEKDPKLLTITNQQSQLWSRNFW